MTQSSNRDVVDRFVAALAARDVEALADVLAPDAIEEFPQSGERFRGRDNIIGVASSFPGGLPKADLVTLAGSEDRWVVTSLLTVLKVEGSGDRYTCVWRVEYPDSGPWFMVAMLGLREGKTRGRPSTTGSRSKRRLGGHSGATPRCRNAYRVGRASRAVCP